MIKRLLFLIFLIPAFLGCLKICVPHQYKFSGGLCTIYPDEDSIRVGDTIWLNCSIPLNLKYNSGSGFDSVNYDISGSTNFITDFHITVPLGVNTQVGAIDSFGFLSIKGGVQPNLLDLHASKTLSFAEIGNNYFALLAIIPKKRGIYGISILDLYQGMKNCDKFSVSIMMSDMDNHLHYLKDIYYGGGPINPLDSTHTYCFKVY